jgi:GNAT superfamily N-acetyltransferase
MTSARASGPSGAAARWGPSGAPGASDRTAEANATTEANTPGASGPTAEADATAPPQADGALAAGAGGTVVSVRRIRPGDTARMRALRLEMLADSPLAFLETLADAAARPHAEFAARVARNAVGTTTAQFVADSGGRLVGHAGGHAAPENPGLTVIFAVYISPAWRGSGLLAHLIEAVAAWSRAAGRRELLLEVVVGNHPAVRAYQRLGFVDMGLRLPHPTLPALTELQMRRSA